MYKNDSKLDRARSMSFRGFVRLSFCGAEKGGTLFFPLCSVKLEGTKVPAVCRKGSAMRAVHAQEHHHEFLEIYYFMPSDFEKSGPVWLIRTGITEGKPNYHIGPKISPYHYMIFVLEGEGRFIQGNRTYSLRPNDLFCLFPNVTHEYYTMEKTPLRTVWIAFDGKQATPLMARLGLRPYAPYKPGVVNADLLELFAEFFAWNRSQDKRDTDLLRLSLFYRLFDALTAIMSDEGRKAERLDSWLHKGKEYLQTHYAEGVTIEMAAAYAGVDRTHFSKTFHRTYGKSPAQYVRQLKMDEARRLLAEEERKLAEIAQSVGYPDLFSFSKAFKKTFGMPPSAYRQSLADGPGKA